MTPPPRIGRAVFLDRDGTLNREQSFVTDPDAALVLPGVKAALARLRAAGFTLAVVTNQSAVARGMLSEAGLAAIQWRLHEELDRQISGWFHAPWHPEGGHGYGMAHPDRKPGPGLLHKAAGVLGLQLEGSVIMGDAARDLLAARDLPITRVLLQCGKPWQEQVARLEAEGCPPHHIAPDLPSATDWWLAQQSG